MLTFIVCGVIFWAIILAIMRLPEMIAEQRYRTTRATRRSRNGLPSPPGPARGTDDDDEERRALLVHRLFSLRDEHAGPAQCSATIPLRYSCSPARPVASADLAARQLGSQTR